MPKVAKHRDAIVQSAALLFRQQGFAATGMNQIVARSGAPKGSIYHYFPDGKEAIGAAAVTYAGERVTHTLTALRDEGLDPPAMVRRYAALLCGWLTESDFRDGCPVSTILLETTPQSPAIRAAGITAFASWARVFCESLRAKSVSQVRAERLANLATAALQGALMQARVAMRVQPLTDAAEEIALAFSGAMATHDKTIPKTSVEIPDDNAAA